MIKKIIFISLYTAFTMMHISACNHASTTDEPTMPINVLPTVELSPTTCPEYMKDPEDMPPKIALKIREDFSRILGVKLEDIWIQKYFGNYNGCEVVFMGGHFLYTQAMRYVEIAGYTVVYPSGQEVCVYNESKFYTLKGAYDINLLSKEDVYEIGKQINPEFNERNPVP